MNNSSSTKQQQLQLPSLLKPEALEMQVKQSVRCHYFHAKKEMCLTLK
jgi:hypothetical protein